MREIIGLMQQRHSARAAYDPDCPVADRDLRQILEAARWAPTAHNMQDFEIIVVDDPATLAEIGAIRRDISATFLRENYQQLSFSEDELRQRKTGVLASMFPPSWRSAEPDAAALAPGLLRDVMRGCPVLLVVLYDPRTRAPASEGDALGTMSRGCVMQNMWLAAEDLGIGLQVLSVVGAESIEAELRRVLRFPPLLKVAFACRVGYPAAPSEPYLRVRREVVEFTHRNHYGNRMGPAAAA